jgi:hypothetical protein
MGLSVEEQKVAAEMLRERLSHLQGEVLVAEVIAFRNATEDELRAGIKAFAQTRLGQAESALAGQRALTAELENSKKPYEAVLRGDAGSGL